MVNEEQVYEDDDDENEEDNWRNDYPDSDNDGDSDREERYVGTLGSAHCLMWLLVSSDALRVMKRSR